MSDVGIKELEGMFQNCLDLRAEHKEMKAETSQKWHDYEKAIGDLGDQLDELGMDEFTTSFGKFSMSEDQGYLTPKDDDSRNVLFEYLKKKGMYNTMRTVNANTLKTFVKSEIELAEEKGDFNFQVPGVMLGELTRKYKLTKKVK